MALCLIYFQISMNALVVHANMAVPVLMAWINSHVTVCLGGLATDVNVSIITLRETDEQKAYCNSKNKE